MKFKSIHPSFFVTFCILHIDSTKLVVNPCDTAGCSDGCSVNGNSFLCHCNKNPLKKLSVDQKTCGKFNNILQCQKLIKRRN